jgi:uncharacterized protein YndB with AHSA1/START domain
MGIKRIVKAPIDLVWKVWTSPEHIKHWWGPAGFTNTISEMDVRPGGVYGSLSCMDQMVQTIRTNISTKK